ncbi:MAG: hypothetical protein H6623_06135 [Bdellovibrionaceae bacterium]|nr:hypothetical protein [Pseudobdellovibrionaceae bacterium]
MSLECKQCQSKKAYLECGICKESICKKCAVFLDAEAFLYMQDTPPFLTQDCYCYTCFSEKVQPLLNSYYEDVEKTKEVYVFYRTQGKETSQYKRTFPQVTTDNALDEQDTLMRLAYLAVRNNCNALVDVNVQAKKIRDHAYQTMRWSGVGNPVQIDADRLDRAENLRRFLQSR